MDEDAFPGLTIMHEKSRSRFVLCIRNDGAEDLELRKVYQVLGDQSAAGEGYARVIDESGEDYLYPAEYFVPVKLPAAISRKWVSLSNGARQPVRRAAAHG
jgi:hypothetical protein